jgi:hypothetical protein
MKLQTLTMKPLSLRDFCWHRDTLSQSREQDDLFQEAVRCCYSYRNEKTSENLRLYSKSILDLQKTFDNPNYEPLDIFDDEDMEAIIIAVVEMETSVQYEIHDYVIFRK